MTATVDAVVVGSGPNGLAAAVTLAQAGWSVRVLEAAPEIGGGMRSAELTLPGFLHDRCSAVHPLGVLSPFFRTLPLDRFGLEWRHPPTSVAHPLDGGRAALLERSPADTAHTLGADGPAWEKLVRPFLADPDALLQDLLGPLARWPRRPLQMARFGMLGLRSAAGLARGRFEGEAARALFAGCAAHSILPLESLTTAAVGLVFAITAHVETWPVARGGSQSIARALAAMLADLGGTIELDRRVASLADVPASRVVLFDTSPAQLARIAGDALPARFRRRLERYRYGPGVFKVDWALSGPIPWAAPECARASTVHVGGTLDEIAASERAMFAGEISERPFLIVCQQSHFDDSRAPAGQHTGYAYCHVPAGSTVDMTDAIERQMERFAPGFRDVILARHTTSPAALEKENPSYHGGAITGGVADLRQLIARPTLRATPYATPNPRLWICSASTPPGGGVHGMCGYHAAIGVLRKGTELRSLVFGPELPKN